MHQVIILQEVVKEFGDKVEKLQLHFDKAGGENTRNEIEEDDSPGQCKRRTASITSR
ncbi:MAG: hypothetical protein OXF56_10145 [Rhodobacteraceae bacterium]|nr:hypothetical protein [Paracoccaceae bacterium]